MSKKFKKTQYEERIMNEINRILRSEISDSRLNFVSVTKVELNPDYSCANVYWDTFDASKRGDSKKAISGVAGKIRSLLAKNLKVRHTPEITFEYDNQFESEKAISDLLEEESKLGRGH